MSLQTQYHGIIVLYKNNLVVMMVSNFQGVRSVVAPINLNIDPSKGILWGVFVFLLIFSAILLSGHGENLVAGYNTAGKEEKDKYNGKKLSRVVGIGISFITLLVLIMALFLDSLPSFFIYIFISLVLATSVVLIILANTICKK